MELGEESGLTEDELAFYDALGDNESAREVMQDETLVLIARELSDRIEGRLRWIGHNVRLSGQTCGGRYVGC